MPDLLLPYVGLIVLLTITPGPDMVLVLRNGLRAGTSAAWMTGVGCCSGIAIHAVAATVGLSAILAASAEAFTVLKLAGAAYLIWLGVSSIVSTIGRPSEDDEALAALARSQPEPARIDTRTAFRQGLISNLLNPKIAILFLTLLPQFIATGEPRVATTAFLAATFIAVGLVWMRLFSLALGPISRALRREAIGEWIERVTGAVLIAIGVGVALERR